MDHTEEPPLYKDMRHLEEPPSHNGVNQPKDSSPCDVDQLRDHPSSCSTKELRDPSPDKNQPCDHLYPSDADQLMSFASSSEIDQSSDMGKCRNPTSPTDTDSPSDPSSPSEADHPRKYPSTVGNRKQARLQERRGSNVALVLDVSILGMVEPLCSVSTPRDTIIQLLRTRKRPLDAAQLQEASRQTQTLDLEYQQIPPNFVNASELDIPGHALKDRYKTILPNPDTRVLLKGSSAEAEDKSYINANYIRGYGGADRRYIATQGPMVNTLVDFWEMVWQEQSAIIVMITELKETKEKCVQYWPDDNGVYGRVSVDVTSMVPCNGYTVREMTVQVGSESRQVRHYWYSTWPDHQIPKCAGPLLQLVLDVQFYRKTLCDSGPTIVHCRFNLPASSSMILL